MKKLILTSIALLFALSSVGVFAGDVSRRGFQTDGMSGGVIAPSTITTYTSEPCGFTGAGSGQQVAFGKIPSEMGKRYPCTVGTENGFVDFISEIYRFMYFMALIFAVIMVVLAGMFLTMSGAAGEKAKEFAKQWIPKILMGIVWLLFIPFVLKTVAPFFFN